MGHPGPANTASARCSRRSSSRTCSPARPAARSAAEAGGGRRREPDQGDLRQVAGAGPGRRRRELTSVAVVEVRDLRQGVSTAGAGRARDRRRRPGHRARASTWSCSARPAAARPRCCARSPAWSSRPPATCSSTARWSPACRRGPAVAWCSRATRSTRTRPCSATSCSRCGRTGCRPEEREKRARWAAELLGIDHLLDRKPRQLSGGERQRVALARALVREPQVFLLDEPLSNLDAKLRASARDELKRFQEEIGTTTIYVTHDQVEAMGLGDRIAVLSEGTVRQVGPPVEVYDDPADTFVATFIGSPPMNLVPRGRRCWSASGPSTCCRPSVAAASGPAARQLAVRPHRVPLRRPARVRHGRPGSASRPGWWPGCPPPSTTPIAAGERHDFAVPGGTAALLRRRHRRCDATAGDGLMATIAPMRRRAGRSPAMRHRRARRPRRRARLDLPDARRWSTSSRWWRCRSCLAIGVRALRRDRRRPVVRLRGPAQLPARSSTTRCSGGRWATRSCSPAISMVLIVVLRQGAGEHPRRRLPRQVAGAVPGPAAVDDAGRRCRAISWLWMLDSIFSPIDWVLRRARTARSHGRTCTGSASRAWRWRRSSPCTSGGYPARRRHHDGRPGRDPAGPGRGGAGRRRRLLAADVRGDHPADAAGDRGGGAVRRDLHVHRHGGGATCSPTAGPTTPPRC